MAQHLHGRKPTGGLARPYSSDMWEELKPQLVGLDLPVRWDAFVDRIRSAADPEEMYNTSDGQSLKAIGHYDGLAAKPLHNASEFPFTRDLEAGAADIREELEAWIVARGNAKPQGTAAPPPPENDAMWTTKASKTSTLPWAGAFCFPGTSSSSS